MGGHLTLNYRTLCPSEKTEATRAEGQNPTHLDSRITHQSGASSIPALQSLSCPKGKAGLGLLWELRQGFLVK